MSAAGKQARSFFEKKEPKKLHSFSSDTTASGEAHEPGIGETMMGNGLRRLRHLRAKRTKVFLLLFLQKKKRFLASALAER